MGGVIVKMKRFLVKLKRVAEANAPAVRVLGINTRVVYYLGFWPTEVSADWLSYWRHLFPRVQLVRMSYSVVFHAYNVVLVWGDLFKVVEYTYMIFLHGMILVKGGTLFFYRDRLSAILRTLEQLQDGRHVPDESARDLLRGTDSTAQGFSRRILLGALVILAGNQLSLIIQGLMTRTIPFRLWLPYAYDSSPIFEVTLLFIMIAMIADIMLIIICDMQFVGITMHIVGQLKLLSYKVENIHSIVNEMTNNKALETIHPHISNVLDTLEVPWVGGNEMNAEHCIDVEEDTMQVNEQSFCNSLPEAMRKGDARQMEDYLKHCVKHHQTLIQLTNDMGSVFKVMLAQQVLYNTMCGLTCLYVSTLAPVIDTKVTAIVSAMFGCCLQLLLYCWYGNQITEQSMKVRDAIYDCDWFETSESFKRSMRIIISRTNKPLVIKAAGLPLSVGTFRLIIRAAHYLHSILRKIYHGEKISRGH